MLITREDDQRLRQAKYPARRSQRKIRAHCEGPILLTGQRARQIASKTAQSGAKCVNLLPLDREMILELQMQ